MCGGHIFRRRNSGAAARAAHNGPDSGHIILCPETRPDQDVQLHAKDSKWHAQNHRPRASFVCTFSPETLFHFGFRFLPRTPFPPSLGVLGCFSEVATSLANIIHKSPRALARSRYMRSHLAFDSLRPKRTVLARSQLGGFYSFRRRA